MNNINKKTILIIEDEASYRQILSEKLKLEGFDIITANNGEEGFSMAIEKHPDLIISDIQMPLMNGLEMLKKIRIDEWGKNAKIMILTAFDDTVNISNAVELEAFEYIVKANTEIEDLVQRVKKKLS